MSRRKHPHKDIESAIKYAEENAWRVETGGSHAWGKMYCPYNDKECRCGEFCQASIWRVVDNCTTHASNETGQEANEQ
jgi:hypothetical protein